MRHLVLAGAAIAMTIVAPQSQPDRAATWPGLWGPSRNASLANAGSVTRLEPLWRKPTQGGYSEVAVSAGAAVTMELRDGNDFVVAFDSETGQERWRTTIGPTYKGHGGSDDGPISTPALTERHVFALSPHGALMALDRRTGAERWRHDLPRQFGATPPTWGFAASPLAINDLVVVPAGGAKGRGLLAFRQDTGELKWTTPGIRSAAYTSAVEATIGGVRQIIAAATDRIMAVRPSDGVELWSTAGPGGTIEMANSPILIEGGRVLVSTWEESRLVGITRTGDTWRAEEVWRTPRLRGSNGPVIYRNGFLYGFAGPMLICMDARNAEVRWRERTGAGTLIGVGGQLLVLLEESGELVVAGITPERYVEQSRQRVVAAGRAVTGPSYAAGRVYVRTLREIAAFRVR